MLFSVKKRRQPGVWFDPEDHVALFPPAGTPEYHDKLVAGDLTAAFFDPEKDRVEMPVDDTTARYKDLRTPFYGYVRNLIRELNLKEALGRAKAKEIEGRAKQYPYYKEKSQFKALARIQLSQPIPQKGRPGEFWWAPEKGSKPPNVRGRTPEERQEIYDQEAEQMALWLILHGQFNELVAHVDTNLWLQEENLASPSLLKEKAEQSGNDA